MCFFGLTRSLRTTYCNIARHAILPLHAAGFAVDTFVHAWTMPSISSIRSGEKDAPLRQDEWGMLPRVRAARIAPQREFEGTVSVAGQEDWWRDGFRTIRNLYCQYESLRQVTEMWRSGEPPGRYAVVMYVRPDLAFLDPVDAAVVRRVAGAAAPTWANPDWQQWSGQNDRFAFGTPEAMAHYGLRGRLAANYSQQHRHLHAERILGRAMRVPGLQRIGLARPRLVRVRAAPRTADGSVGVPKLDQPILDSWRRDGGDERTLQLGGPIRLIPRAAGLK